MRPEIFVVETVLGCDLKCPECAVGGNFITRKKGHMTFEQFKIIADKIQSFCKYLYLHLWGEPMLNRDIFKMIEYASAFTATNISTNANSLTEEKAKKLIASGVAVIIVSIDGVTQEVYERYRVGGSVEKALKGLEMLQHFNIKAGVKVRIIPQFVVMRHNRHEVEKFREHCEILGLVASFKTPYIRNRQSHFRPVSDYMRPYFNDLMSLRDAMTRCVSVRNVFNILLDGSVALCCHDYNGVTAFGNIYKQGVIQIWEEEGYSNARTSIAAGNALKFCVENCKTYGKSQ
ncbi:MAG: radical SAM protein [Thermodesulfovibrionia bacterium]|nr:radical SAM protein [Thermodesulfovibrionia bacterium]